MQPALPDVAWRRSWTNVPFRLEVHRCGLYWQLPRWRTVAQAQAQVGNLAGGRPFDLSLKITATLTGPVVSPAEFELTTGKYYRLNVTSEGEPDWRLELPDLLQNSHLRIVAINGIEVHLPALVFRAIEFDTAGTASISFTPIRPGTYRFTVGPTMFRHLDAKRVESGLRLAVVAPQALQNFDQPLCRVDADVVVQHRPPDLKHGDRVVA